MKKSIIINNAPATLNRDAFETPLAYNLAKAHYCKGARPEQNEDMKALRKMSDNLLPLIYEIEYKASVGALTSKDESKAMSELTKLCHALGRVNGGYISCATHYKKADKEGVETHASSLYIRLRVASTRDRYAICDSALASLESERATLRKQAQEAYDADEMKKYKTLKEQLALISKKYNSLAKEYGKTRPVREIASPGAFFSKLLKELGYLLNEQAIKSPAEIKAEKEAKKAEREARRKSSAEAKREEKKRIANETIVECDKKLNAKISAKLNGEETPADKTPANKKSNKKSK